MTQPILDEPQLDELLTRPRPVLIEALRAIPGPLVVLGAGGKMGPTLCVLARRAAEEGGRPLEVVAVSRFSDKAARRWLEQRGVRTVSADLLDREAVGRLPDASHLVYLVGLKFGTAKAPQLTWAINTLAPAHAAERYRGAPTVALSTGNVYPLVPVAGGGAREDHPLTPLGEYANAAVARERILEHCSLAHGTPLALIRLNYAVELRYGVLVDIGQKVLQGRPIVISNGYLNCIWQGDANEMILRALGLASAPASAWNLTSPRILRVRDLAVRLGQLLGREAIFEGEEEPTAHLSDASRIVDALGAPPTDLGEVLAWTAAWLKMGGRLLGRPTSFEVRDGRY